MRPSSLPLSSASVEWDRLDVDAGERSEWVTIDQERVRVDGVNADSSVLIRRSLLQKMLSSY